MRTVKWDITYKCNLNCAHCINGELLGNLEGELSTDEVISAIRNLSKDKVDYVHLLGGEPTARKDFLQVIAEFEKENIDFGFNTNGLKLSNEEMMEKLVKNRSLKNIIISLEGPNSEINDAIRGKRVFDITTKNLKHFIELKQIFKREELRVTVNMVVSKANFRYVSEMANLCVDLGVSELVLLQFIPEGNGKKNDMSLSIKDIKFLIGEVAIIYGKVKEKLDIIPKFVMPYAEKYCKVKYKKEFPKFYSMCGAGESFFFINNKGEVFPCDSYQDKIIEKNNIEDLKIDSRDLLEIIDKEGFNDIFELTEGDDIYMGVEPCKDCEYLRKQCYPCVLSLMNTGGKVVNVCKAMKEEVESECF